MKKLINSAETVVTEALEGVAAAHPSLSVDVENKVIVRAGGPTPGKVGLVSGGGSGHEPLHGGFVGYGMLDAACPGEVFTSPVPDQMLAATQAVNGGAGVLHVVKNVMPAASKPTFELGEAEAELGIGIHGEPGRTRAALAPASELAAVALDAISTDLPVGGDLLVMVNGMGGTPLIELYLMFNEVRKYLEARGGHVARNLVGNYITSLEMQGFSVTVCQLTDTLTRLWDAPVDTPALRWGR